MVEKKESNESSSDKIAYKNKVMFLRLSKKGQHLYAFDRDGILGQNTDSLVLNVSEVKALVEGKVDWCKISAMRKEEEK